MKRLVLLAAMPALCLVATALPATAQQVASEPGIQNTLTTVQQRLQTLGYENAAPTGQYDSTTRQALQAFQNDHGLRRTGQVDLPTLAELGIPVEPTQSAGLAPQTAMAPAGETDEQIAELRYRNAPAYNFPLLRDDEHMTSPQVHGQGDPFAPQGYPEHLTVSPSGRIPGVEPSFPSEDITR